MLQKELTDMPPDDISDRKAYRWKNRDYDLIVISQDES